MRGKIMNRRLMKTALSAACALSPLVAIPAGPASAQSVTAPRSEIVLSIGKGELVTVPGSMSDVFVANDQVADVQVKSQRQLYVFGKSGGETTVYASNAAGDIVWSANVRRRLPSGMVSVPYVYAPTSCVSRCHRPVRSTVTSAGMPISTTRPRGLVNLRHSAIEPELPTASMVASAPPDR